MDGTYGSYPGQTPSGVEPAKVDSRSPCRGVPQYTNFSRWLETVCGKPNHKMSALAAPVEVARPNRIFNIHGFATSWVLGVASIRI
jgi:hypothetical protein